MYHNLLSNIYIKICCYQYIFKKKNFD